MRLQRRNNWNAKLIVKKWLARYNELIEYKKRNRSAAFMCGGKLGAWVNTQRAQYRDNTMT